MSAGGSLGEDVREGLRGGREALRVFISYAHDHEEHEERVRGLWQLLRANGIDARLDLPAAEEERQDWAEWMTRQVRDADRVLVVASPEYRRRAEGDAEPGEGRGVQWEARLIRGRFYADQRAGPGLVLPVVLPGCSAEDLPLWLAPASTAHYVVREYTVAGAEPLLRMLTGQSRETIPPLGEVPFLPPRGGASAARAPRPAAAAGSPGPGRRWRRHIPSRRARKLAAASLGLAGVAVATVVAVSLASPASPPPATRHHSTSSPGPAASSTAPLPISRNDRWLAGLDSLRTYMNNAQVKYGNAAMVTPALLRAQARQLRTCTPELAALGIPGASLRQEYEQARRACAQFSQAANCYTAAAGAFTESGPGLSKFARLLGCGDADLNKGSYLLATTG